LKALRFAARCQPNSAATTRLAVEFVRDEIYFVCGQEKASWQHEALN